MAEPSEFLSPADVKVLAGGEKTLEGQAAALTALGIPHRVLRRRVLVSRHHVRIWLSGEQVMIRRPNFGAVK